MAIEQVRAYFAGQGMADRVLEFEASSATVELAARAVGVEGARIAKTLSFKGVDSNILLVAAGDAKVDNAKYKAQFGVKAKMLSADEVLEATGHAVGGVCPFALKTDVPVYLDVSMQRFSSVYPACGSGNSAVKLTPDELFRHANARAWVDICKGWQAE